MSGPDESCITSAPSPTTATTCPGKTSKSTSDDVGANAGDQVPDVDADDIVAGAVINAKIVKVISIIINEYKVLQIL